jgi:hypothetical protein
MTQFSMVGFDGIGLAFVGDGLVLTGRLDERLVEGEGIGIVLVSLWAAVQHGLKRFWGSLRDHGPAHNT